jgi:hypothetical protein
MAHWSLLSYNAMAVIGENLPVRSPEPAEMHRIPVTGARRNKKPSCETHEGFLSWA